MAPGVMQRLNRRAAQGRIAFFVILAAAGGWMAVAQAEGAAAAYKTAWTKFR